MSHVRSSHILSALLLLTLGCVNVELQIPETSNPTPDMRADMTTDDMSADMMIDPDQAPDDMADMDAPDADMMVEPDQAPDDMADMMVEPDMMADMMADMSDMAQDMGQDMPDMAQPCGGMCGPTEECRQNTCINLCAGLECGQVARTAGGTVTCGACVAGQVCAANMCEDACLEARAECGELLWSGQTAQCGACMGGTGCFGGACMTGTANGWRDVAAGQNFTCAARATGAVFCWGDNSAKQLGANVARYLVPTQVAGITNVIELDAASQHVCAIDTNRRLWCWGLNDNGQIGNSSTMNQPVPTQVNLGGASVTALAASLWHTCAAAVDGKTRCWGFSGQGQLGDNTTQSSYQPVESRNLTATAGLDAGLAHTCAWQQDGTAWCWGSNGSVAGGDGRLGQGQPLAGRVSPSKVVNLDSDQLRQVVTGNKHSCALLQTGRIKCWGDNVQGQLGNNSNAPSASPVNVADVTDAIFIAAGLEHTCAVLADRTLRCWGRNDEGQLGTGNKNVARTPITVTNLTDITHVALGYYHSCAVSRDGRMYCWGKNAEGQVGDNSTTERLTPVLIP